MKYLVLLFWAVILGQVVGYIAVSLAGVAWSISMPFIPMLVLSVFVTLVVMAVTKISMTNEDFKH
jgi:prepilin signal peptidase PulO-like enzyme (type II secretory pathway)